MFLQLDCRTHLAREVKCLVQNPYSRIYIRLLKGSHSERTLLFHPAMTILIETVGNHTIFSKPATLKQILKNPFTYKDKVRRERVKVCNNPSCTRATVILDCPITDQAIIAAQQASPTLDFGGVTIINPVSRFNGFILNIQLLINGYIGVPWSQPIPRS